MSPTTPKQRFYWYLARAAREPDPEKALTLLYLAVDAIRWDGIPAHHPKARI